ncbi:MAG TPA: CYTH domain-containing protein [Chloroflexota bacterium]|nr:CYTH domain-containing protein [Chloroflexota bacterium]
MTAANLERELKLRPDEPELLDRLAVVDRLGPFTVTGRRREIQRNGFFDSSSRAFGGARVSFRRRTIQGASLATWTLKGEGQQARGVATRTEIELQLEPDMAPAVAIGALRQAASQRGATALAEALGDALAVGGLPLARPYLETETDRTIVDLEAADRGWSVELALDRVRLVGHGYAELEIEAELKRGDDATLEAARQAIIALGPTHDSEGSKLSRALAHVGACSGC